MILSPYRALEKAIGYRFRRKKRLEAALTHRSFRHEQEEVDIDNQRLEFLGDAALGLVTASYLYENFPELQEGEMTRLRSRVTSTRALAQMAQQIDLGRYLRLGQGEQNTGGHQRESILADAMEAVIGAAFSEGQYKAVERIFKAVVEEHLREAVGSRERDNAKGSLQEWAQRNVKANPRYKVLDESGPPHARSYTVSVSIKGCELGVGQGPNKQTAEFAAAARALLQVDQEGFKLQTAPPATNLPSETSTKGN